MKFSGKPLFRIRPPAWPVKVDEFKVLDENPTAANLHDMPVVVPTTRFQMRRTKNVKSKCIQKIVRSCDVGFLQQARVMRMSDDFFNDGITSGWIGVDN